MSQKLQINELRPHKRNDIYFDDIEGDSWSEFLESVRTSGIIEPIVVTQDKVIVSGHQRVRACKALGIKEIDAEVRIIESEDEVLKQLIETNIRQRGVGNTNPVKFGRCLMELERIYGIQHGGNHGNQHTVANPNNSELAKSQDDLASELGISVDTLNNYKKLAQAIPEIQSLVESGRVTKTVALSIMKKLTEDEQRQLADMLPHDAKKLSDREIKFYTDRISKLTEENKSLRDMQPSTIEVIPDDYDELKEMLESEKSKSERLSCELEEFKKQVNNNHSLEAAIAELKIFREKYAGIEELSGVFAAIENL